MFDFSDVPFSHGTWPNVTARNETAFGLKDGTKLWETWLGDFFGMVQFFMSRAQIDPNGTIDSVSASQIAKAIMGSCGYPGEIVWWAGITIPDYVRLLPLNGRSLDYQNSPLGLQALVDATYCGDAANATAPAFYKTDAIGTRDINGGLFKLPDMRGRFIRAIDEYSHLDPDGVRKQGSTQVSIVGKHKHEGLTYQTGGGAFEYSVGIYNSVTGSGSHTCQNVERDDTPSVSFFTGEEGPSISTETRPVNMAFQACIRY